MNIKGEQALSYENFFNFCRISLGQIMSMEIDDPLLLNISKTFANDLFELANVPTNQKISIDLLKNLCLKKNNIIDSLLMVMCCEKENGVHNEELESSQEKIWFYQQIKQTAEILRNSFLNINYTYKLNSLRDYAPKPFQFPR